MMGHALHGCAPSHPLGHNGLGQLQERMLRPSCPSPMACCKMMPWLPLGLLPPSICREFQSALLHWWSSQRPRHLAVPRLLFPHVIKCTQHISCKLVLPMGIPWVQAIAGNSDQCFSSGGSSRDCLISLCHTALRFLRSPIVWTRHQPGIIFSVDLYFYLRDRERSARVHHCQWRG